MEKKFTSASFFQVVLSWLHAWTQWTQFFSKTHLQHKHRTSIAFMWHHYQSVSEMFINVFLPLKIVESWVTSAGCFLQMTIQVVLGCICLCRGCTGSVDFLWNRSLVWPKHQVWYHVCSRTMSQEWWWYRHHHLLSIYWRNETVIWSCCHNFRNVIMKTGFHFYQILQILHKSLHFGDICQEKQNTTYIKRLINFEFYFFKFFS